MNERVPEQHDIYSKWRKKDKSPVQINFYDNITALQKQINDIFSLEQVEEEVPYFFIARTEDVGEDFVSYTIKTEKADVGTIKIECIKNSEKKIAFIHTLFCLFDDNRTLFVQYEAFKEFIRMIHKTRALPLYSDRYKLTGKGQFFWEKLCQDGLAVQTKSSTVKGEPMYRSVL